MVRILQSKNSSNRRFLGPQISGGLLSVLNGWYYRRKGVARRCLQTYTKQFPMLYYCRSSRDSILTYDTDMDITWNGVGGDGQTPHIAPISGMDLLNARWILSVVVPSIKNIPPARYKRPHRYSPCSVHDKARQSRVIHRNNFLMTRAPISKFKLKNQNQFCKWKLKSSNQILNSQVN